MTDELQADEGNNGITLDNNHVEGEEIESQEPETTLESGAELAPASGGDQNKNDDGVQKAINKQHAKFREEERKRIEIEKEAKELREKLDAFEAQKGDVTIPNMPDRYDFDSDEEFNAQVKARDEAIMQKARQDAQQQSVLEQQSAAKEAAEKAEEERVQALIGGYTQQINKLGLNADEVRVAGDIVVKNGIDPQVAEYILGDEDGPLITKYLADNPIIQDELRYLPTIEAAMKINSEIRSNAALMKPQASNAPDPAEVLDGRGAGEQVSQFIKGAKFE